MNTIAAHAPDDRRGGATKRSPRAAGMNNAAAAAAIDPEDYVRLQREPGFLAIRAVPRQAVSSSTVS